MQQVFHRPAGGAAVLCRTGVLRRSPPRRGPYGPFFALELRGLPGAPLVWVGALFFLTFFTSARERRAAVLTAATPADPRRYALARCAAALVGVALLCLAALALAALLYARLFGWTDWGSLALPALVILAPPLVFALGSGWLLGRLRPWLLYVWMLLPFALAALPLPEALGLWNGGLCTSYPLTLGMLDPAFSLPAAAWAVQGLLLAAGVLLLLVAGKGKKVYNQ